MLHRVPEKGWREPVRVWWLSLRLWNGERDMREVKGDLKEARKRRDELLQTGKYELAWLGEKKR